MLIEHRLEMRFQRSHVQEPVISEMARRFDGVLFSIEAISVGNIEAAITLRLVGQPAVLDEVRAYFSAVQADIRTLSEEPFTGEIPSVPRRAEPSGDPQDVVERKLWLTVLGSPTSRAFLWEMTRRFDVTFKLMQSVSGESVSILSMLLWGPRPEVTGAVAFLRERGANVEFGEISLSAPFTPAG